MSLELKIAAIIVCAAIAIAFLFSAMSLG